jgi:hypothetical protein
MQRFDQKQNELRTYKFRLGFEGVSRLDLEMSGYLCDAGGTLIEGADIEQDELLFTVTEKELADGTVLIVPYPTDAFGGSRLSAEELLARRAFEIELTPEPGRQEYVLPEIPEAVWRRWLDEAEPGAGQRQALDQDFLFY